MDHLDVYFDNIMTYAINFSQGNFDVAAEAMPTSFVTMPVSEIPESMAPEVVEVSTVSSTIICFTKQRGMDSLISSQIIMDFISLYISRWLMKSGKI